MASLEWYRSFVTVYRVGTVSGAAQVLYVTQPGVSQHIAALEAALGQALFVRTPRRMVPTVAGQRLYTQVADAIEKLEAIHGRNAADNAPQLIRLGTPPEFFTERILKHLSKTPLTHYRIHFGLALELIEQLANGQLDLAIATQKIARSDLEYQPIFKEHFWLVAPPDTVVPSEIEADQPALERWLCSQAWVAYAEDLPIIRRFWRIVFDRRIDTVPAVVIPDLRGIRAAVTYGLGFSVLPDYLCEDGLQSGQLTLILTEGHTQLPVPVTPVSVTNDLWLAFRKSDRNAPLTQSMLTTLQTVRIQATVTLPDA